MRTYFLRCLLILGILLKCSVVSSLTPLVSVVERVIEISGPDLTAAPRFSEISEFLDIQSNADSYLAEAEALWTTKQISNKEAAIIGQAFQALSPENFDRWVTVVARLFETSWISERQLELVLFEEIGGIRGRFNTSGCHEPLRSTLEKIVKGNPKLRRIVFLKDFQKGFGQKCWRVGGTKWRL
jgi:hypothetical protein